MHKFSGKILAVACGILILLAVAILVSGGQVVGGMKSVAVPEPASHVIAGLTLAAVMLYGIHHAKFEDFSKVLFAVATMAVAVGLTMSVLGGLQSPLFLLGWDTIHLGSLFYIVSVALRALSCLLKALEKALEKEGD